jgi:hypothetical protein
MINESREILELKQSQKFYKRKNPLKYPHYYGFAVESVRVDGLWLEFGVWTGTSARLITKVARKSRHASDFKSGKKLYGFDSFEGLPEDWTDPETGVVEKEGKKGFFSLSGYIPKPPNDSIVYIKGWFDESLPIFVKDHKDAVAFLHIDCDLYSSTKTIFDNLEDRIVPGTVIMFDEIHGYPGHEAHELKAFLEFVEKAKIEYQWMGHVTDGRQATLIVTAKDGADDTAQKPVYFGAAGKA